MTQSLELKKVIMDKDGYFLIIKVYVQQEEIILLNKYIYAQWLTSKIFITIFVVINNNHHQN